MKILSAVLGVVLIIIGLTAGIVSISEPMALSLAATCFVSGITLLIIYQVLWHLENIDNTLEVIKRTNKATDATLDDIKKRSLSSAQDLHLQSKIMSLSLKLKNPTEFAKLVLASGSEFNKEEIDWANSILNPQASNAVTDDDADKVVTDGT